MNESMQFGRKLSLILKAGEKGVDLSEFHVKFRIKQTDGTTPNEAEITIYNLGLETVRRVGSEFSEVILQAGYENGNFGLIFKGTLKQTKYGKESANTTYLKIFAADGDTFRNFLVSNVSLARGSSAAERQAAIAKSAGISLDPRAPNGLPGGILPRGRVLFGMSHKLLQSQGENTGTRYTTQNGVLVAIPVQGYLKDEVVVLSAETGLINIPEVTEDGVQVRCLLNPRIKIGTALKIDNKSIVNTVIQSIDLNPADQLQYPATVASDGLYRTMVIDYDGDNRGQSWYCDLTCLAINPGVDALRSVRAFGAVRDNNDSGGN